MEPKEEEDWNRDDDDAKVKKARRTKRLAEKKVERDKWQEEMAKMDTERMKRSKQIFHSSLLSNLPLQPACIYPVCVDSRNGVFLPSDPIADIIIPDHPISDPGAAKTAQYHDAMSQVKQTALFHLATEMHGFQTGCQPECTGSLDKMITSAFAKYHIVSAAVCILATAVHYERGYGVVAVFPTGSSLEVIEMAFFAHGTLLRASADENKFTCYYAEEGDAKSAVQKMNGRVWKSGTLSVSLVE
eukprot:TRINITY_DN52005_c0_g1_i1.p1 TRINITY_DN52005_c0_g1~~TRINITY_DN52005_c0_g1_i1.p1  ORF type:complete len:244 (+),score=72.33 TRINITY_DN52005_c0_g1_i1:45-776(+)